VEALGEEAETGVLAGAVPGEEEVGAEVEAAGEAQQGGAAEAEAGEAEEVPLAGKITIMIEII
jgi:hypothetical protein